MEQETSKLINEIHTSVGIMSVKLDSLANEMPPLKKRIDSLESSKNYFLGALCAAGLVISAYLNYFRI